MPEAMNTVASGGAPSTGANGKQRRQHQHKSSDALTKSHVVVYNQKCMKTWMDHESSVFEKVRSELPRHMPKALDAKPLDDVSASIDDSLFKETCALFESISWDDCAANKPLQELSRITNSESEQEASNHFSAASIGGQTNLLLPVKETASQWWEDVVDKIAARTCDNSSKSFMDRLGAAFSHRDPEVEAQLVEMLNPFQHQIEQYIQTDLREKMRDIGANELRLALKEGSHPAVEHLEVTAHTTVANFASTFFDDRVSQVSQRWRVATQVSSLTDSALVELGTVANEAIKSFGSLRGTSVDESTGSSNTSPACSSTATFLARAREITRPLEDDLTRLTASVTKVWKQTAGSPDDAGDEGTPPASANDGSRGRSQPKSSDVLTKAHVIEYNQKCTRSWRAHEKGVFDKVRNRLSRHIPRALDASIGDKLFKEACALLKSTPRGGNAAIKLLQADHPGLSQLGKNSLELDAKQWWHGVVDKVVARTCDNHNKSFLDRLGAAFSARDAEVGAQVLDLLKPYQHRVEQCIQTELSERIAMIGAEELRKALNEGSHPALEHLEVTIHTAMAKFASTFSDDRIRKVSQRWRSAIQVSSLTDSALNELSHVANKEIKLLASHNNSLGMRISSSKSCAAALLVRAQKISRPLEDDLVRLSASTEAVRQAIAKQAAG